MAASRCASRWAALSALVVAGCVPTLSQPRGEAHLAAMADATRHYHHGRTEDAAQAWGEAARTAERRVDRDEAEYRRARALLRLERVDEALALLDDIAARRPISRRTVRARFDAALVRREGGQREEADEALLWIVRQRPGDGPASRALRLLLESRASEPAAARLAFLRELYAQVGDSDLGDDILSEQAAVLRAGGDRAGAEAALAQLVREHPYPHGQRWDDALWRLAELAEEREDYPAAIRHLEQMIAPHEHTVTPGSQTAPRMPEARLRIARLYRDRLRDWERAAAHFEGMAAQFPTSLLRDDALYELGLMWLELGRRAAGCAALDRVLREHEVGRARRLAERARASRCGD
jgi:tetratricopeptide (TPR) repeat protein